MKETFLELCMCKYPLILYKPMYRCLLEIYFWLVPYQSHELLGSECTLLVIWVGCISGMCFTSLLPFVKYVTLRKRTHICFIIQAHAFNDKQRIKQILSMFVCIKISTVVAVVGIKVQHTYLKCFKIIFH